MFSIASPMDPAWVVHLAAASGITASRTPELRWQHALTCRGRCAK